MLRSVATNRDTPHAAEVRRRRGCRVVGPGGFVFAQDLAGAVCQSVALDAAAAGTSHAAARPSTPIGCGDDLATFSRGRELRPNYLPT